MLKKLTENVKEKSCISLILEQKSCKFVVGQFV